MDFSDTNSLHRKPLVHFGRELIDSARDWPIRQIDGIMDGSAVAPANVPIYEEAKRLSPEAQDFIKRLIPEIVDTTLHYVMFMFQHPTHHGIRISVTTPDGETFPDLDAASDGLAGDLIAWIQAYSKQRYKTFPEPEIIVPEPDLDGDDDEPLERDG
jgi:hypothetical protein